MANSLVFLFVRLLFGIFAVFLLLTESCSKKNSIDEFIMDAVILDWGSPAVDGCGFVLKVDEDAYYYPVDLIERHQVDGKRVRVRFLILDELHTCGFPHSGTRLAKIDIRSIEER